MMIMTVTGDILPLAHVLVPGPVSRDHQVIINKVILVTLHPGIKILPQAQAAAHTPLRQGVQGLVLVLVDLEAAHSLLGLVTDLLHLARDSGGQTRQVLLLLAAEAEQGAPDVARHLVEGADGPPRLLVELRHGARHGGGVIGADGESNLHLE